MWRALLLEVAWVTHGGMRRAGGTAVRAPHVGDLVLRALRAQQWTPGATCRSCTTSGAAWCAGRRRPAPFLRSREFWWQEGLHGPRHRRAEARGTHRRGTRSDAVPDCWRRKCLCIAGDSRAARRTREKVRRRYGVHLHHRGDDARRQGPAVRHLPLLSATASPRPSACSIHRQRAISSSTSTRLPGACAPA